MKENHFHFKRCKNEDKSIPKITRLEEYFPSLSISDHFTFDFRYHQFSETRLWYVCVILQVFVKIVLLTLSFELLSWYRHNLSLNAWNWFYQQLLEKKLIWLQLNQIKPLAFDSWSNTSGWRLFFKWSVSYPCFWPQNSFSTCQQVSCSLRILKTLHLLCILRSSIPLQ